MNKVIRDGNVAVLISPGWGAGWYTWNNFNSQFLFDPILVELVEEKNNFSTDSKRYDTVVQRIVKRAEEIDSEGYYSGIDDLVIRWLPVGTKFIVEEFDGNESIMELNETKWIEA